MLPERATGALPAGRGGLGAGGCGAGGWGLGAGDWGLGAGPRRQLLARLAASSCHLPPCPPTPPPAFPSPASRHPTQSTRSPRARSRRLATAGGSERRTRAAAASSSRARRCSCRRRVSASAGARPRGAGEARRAPLCARPGRQALSLPSFWRLHAPAHPAAPTPPSTRRRRRRYPCVRADGLPPAARALVGRRRQGRQRQQQRAGAGAAEPQGAAVSGRFPIRAAQGFVPCPLSIAPAAPALNQLHMQSMRPLQPDPLPAAPAQPYQPHCHPAPRPLRSCKARFCQPGLSTDRGSHLRGALAGLRWLAPPPAAASGPAPPRPARPLSELPLSPRPARSILFTAGPVSRAGLR
jgi:hypothetical protein